MNRFTFYLGMGLMLIGIVALAQPRTVQLDAPHQATEAVNVCPPAAGADYQIDLQGRDQLVFRLGYLQARLEGLQGEEAQIRAAQQEIIKALKAK